MITVELSKDMNRTFKGLDQLEVLLDTLIIASNSGEDGASFSLVHEDVVILLELAKEKAVAVSERLFF